MYFQHTPQILIYLLLILKFHHHFCVYIRMPSAIITWVSLHYVYLFISTLGPRSLRENFVFLLFSVPNVMPRMQIK